MLYRTFEAQEQLTGRIKILLQPSFVDKQRLLGGWGELACAFNPPLKVRYPITRVVHAHGLRFSTVAVRKTFTFCICTKIIIIMERLNDAVDEQKCA